ncbi:MAG: hypothetical protein HYY96_13965 [Candidatus Tectomicrobia bacterium]|nr:hypothetical protein [Candidatus Tectomicrobia bacterium]
MTAFMRTLKAVSSNCYLLLLLSLILFITSMFEAWETLAEDLSNLNLGAHHGLAILGLFNLAKVLPDVFESLEWVTETEEKE